MTMRLFVLLWLLIVSGLSFAYCADTNAPITLRSKPNGITNTPAPLIPPKATNTNPHLADTAKPIAIVLHNAVSVQTPMGLIVVVSGPEGELLKSLYPHRIHTRIEIPEP